jgi:hypothetical protein
MTRTLRKGSSSKALYCSSNVAGRANPRAITPAPAIKKTKTISEKDLFIRKKSLPCGPFILKNLYYIALFTYPPLA